MHAQRETQEQSLGSNCQECPLRHKNSDELQGSRDSLTDKGFWLQRPWVAYMVAQIVPVIAAGFLPQNSDCVVRDDLGAVIFSSLTLVLHSSLVLGLLAWILSLSMHAVRYPSNISGQHGQNPRSRNGLLGISRGQRLLRNLVGQV